MSNNILELLNGPKGKELIEGISKNTGTTASETQNVLQEALPGILGFMGENAKSSDGATSLLNALNSKHDGSILDSLGDFFGGGGNEKDGNGILGHILGGQKSSFEQNLSAKTGISASQIAKIIALAAPVVMGYLGKQNKSKKTVDNSDGLGDLLGGLLGGLGGGNSGSGNNASTLTKTIGGILGGFMKK